MKTILNIGGAGFIGTELTKQHLNRGDRVFVVDNCSNSIDGEIDVLVGHQNYTFIKEGIETLSEIYFHNVDRFDVIYHLASESTPVNFHDRYLDIISSNVNGIQQIFKLIDRQESRGHTKIVFASTSEVYGYNYSILNEDNNLIVNPMYQRNCYSISKMLTENVLQNELGYRWNIVRFFNVYGPVFRSDEKKVIPALKNSNVNNKPFYLNGDGNQTRSFTHINDLVDGLLRVCEQNHNHEVFNLGNDDSVTINYLIRLVHEQIPDLRILRREGVIGEPYFRAPNNSKARTLLGWTANTPLEKGIKDIFS